MQQRMEWEQREKFRKDWGNYIYGVMKHMSGGIAAYEGSGNDPEPSDGWRYVVRGQSGNMRTRAAEVVSHHIEKFWENALDQTLTIAEIAPVGGAGKFFKFYRNSKKVKKAYKLWKLTEKGAQKIGIHKYWGKFHKLKDGTWWVEDITGHGKSKFKVFKEGKGGLHWFKYADEYGQYIKGKHKGPN